MAFATAHTIALNGALGHLIDVQVDVSPGQVGVTMVGRGDAALREGQDRVRMAVLNSGLHWPATKRTTILLSPADLPKVGTHFDLAIAVALLAAVEVVAERDIVGAAFVGELTLAGGLRPAMGVLPMVLAAAERGLRRVYVPEPQVAEAQLVPQMEVFGVRSLAQVVAMLRHEDIPEAPPVAATSGAQLLTWRGDERLDEIDLADLDGLADVKYAVEVAAAGGHPILLTGPKGAGKTTIAERIPTIMPDLTPPEALELTAIHSLAGTLDPATGIIVRPPYSAPHHDASKASIVGGGQGRVRPGEISRAHCGVLFLDEFPLFRTDVIEALRQPLESGEITVARREESVTMPARCLLVLASNPCPCGNYAAKAGEDRCKCLDPVRRAYQSRISGPIVDRIDITRRVVAAGRAQRDPWVATETSAEVRARVAAARDRQARRFVDRSWRLNSQVPSPRLKDTWPLGTQAQRLIDQQCFEGRLSARGAVRVARLAWTVADLASVRLGRDVAPGADQVDLALALRMAAPINLQVAHAEDRAG
ncbi:YifB family Mg chelatase-like AAA ATPase [Nocardioides humilatus]|uniref:YifB family Mg chelatase-like AAA ATPase n=1 Tax=Nocardioides humilatus TaxID=2607660 RepID=A0A5B1LDG3_9ACTN|nr:YifB family Mg chelatase-like AAA ATPase [Nocardioides humilatus]KAA1418486.1 YifB family Mg chelatase-like AAA ATPase [Nocardioides humilatus]